MPNDPTAERDARLIYRIVAHGINRSRADTAAWLVDRVDHSTRNRIMDFLFPDVVSDDAAAA